MSGITLNSGRQELVLAYVDFDYTMLTSGADIAAIALPHDAVVSGGEVVITTPWNSATSDVLDVGDSGSENRYLNDANIHTAGLTALVPTGYQTTSTTRKITVRWVGVGAAPTAGAGRLAVRYYVNERAAFSQD